MFGYKGARLVGIKGQSFLLLGLVGLLAACSSTSSDLKNMHSSSAACETKSVRQAVNTRFMVERLQVGTPVGKQLKTLGKPVRSMALSHANEPMMEVKFYPMGGQNCPWMLSSDNFMPVITQGGKLMGYGTDTLHTLQNQGWQLLTPKSGWWGRKSYTPTAWAWQSYDYSYLPRR